MFICVMNGFMMNVMMISYVLSDQKTQQPQTFSDSDTKSLVSAVTLGHNLKPKRPEGERSQTAPGRPGSQQQTGDQRTGQGTY